MSYKRRREIHVFLARTLIKRQIRPSEMAANSITSVAADIRSYNLLVVATVVYVVSPLYSTSSFCWDSRDLSNIVSATLQNPGNDPPNSSWRLGALWSRSGLGRIACTDKTIKGVGNHYGLRCIECRWVDILFRILYSIEGVSRRLAHTTQQA
jgi:hypothetical protein